MTREERNRLIAERDKLEPGDHADKFTTLKAADWHRGDWISPPQFVSDDPYGPVVMGSHWLGYESATSASNRAAIARYGGYLPRMPFNRVLDLALYYARLTRRDIYITQACHLIPLNRDMEAVPEELWRESYEAVTRDEIRRRPVIALGKPARLLCEHYRSEIPDMEHLDHPSYARPQVFEVRAREMARALRRAAARAIPSALR